MCAERSGGSFSKYLISTSEASSVYCALNFDPCSKAGYLTMPKQLSITASHPCQFFEIWAPSNAPKVPTLGRVRHVIQPSLIDMSEH